MWQFLERTRAGLLIRAVSQNAEMVHALGTNVDLVRTGVFGLGCAMAAVGGVLAAPLVTAFLGMGTSVVIDAFVIVIIGGMGSFLGSLIGSILVGFRAGARRLLLPGSGARVHVFPDVDCSGRPARRLARQGGLVWRFRSPHHCCRGLVCGLCEQSHARISTGLLVSFDSEIRQYGCRAMTRISKSGHWMSWKFSFAVTALICALLPFILPQYSLTILIEALIFGLFAMSLDLMVGYCRLYSFGHAAAYGLGAYSAALILTHLHLPLPVGMALAVLLTVLFAIPIAWICTRSTGVSFAMLTLAFAQLGYAMLFRFRDITGGSDGITGIPRPAGPFGMTWFQGKIGYYYLVLGCLLASYLLCRAIVRSPFGAVLSGIRENEAKTIALGYNTRAYKIATVVLAYGFGGLAGALYAAFAGFASPELFFWLVSGRVLIMVVVGGAGTLIGPILGGVFFVFVEHQLSQVTDLWPLIFGSIFMVFVMFAPEGIWGLLTSRFKAAHERPERGYGQAGVRCRCLNAKAWCGASARWSRSMVST